jgi:hypothetical protein
VCPEDLQDQSLLEAIREVIRRGEHGFTLHATSRATSEGIPLLDVEMAVSGPTAEIIENYPDDPRGPSCLILAHGSAGDPLHVVCSHPPNVAMISVYRPDPERWIDYRIRR